MKKGYTDVTLIVDRSGSMSAIKEPTENGINKFIRDQAELEGECVLTVVMFDDHYSVPVSAMPVEHVGKQYLYPRGNTALLDAIGKAINDASTRFRNMAENNRPETVVFAIVTDGEENCSKEFTTSAINRMIHEQTTQCNWKFVFLGANQDALATASRIGIERGATLHYAGNYEGTQSAYNSLSSSVSNARMGVSRSFSDADRDAQVKAGVS